VQPDQQDLLDLQAQLDQLGQQDLWVLVVKKEKKVWKGLKAQQE
jgi:hypothetical protein